MSGVKPDADCNCFEGVVVTDRHRPFSDEEALASDSSNSNFSCCTYKGYSERVLYYYHQKLILRKFGAPVLQLLHTAPVLQLLWRHVTESHSSSQ